jgi:hypothetical protein
MCHRQFSQYSGKDNLITVPLYDPDGRLQGAVLVSSELRLPDRIRTFMQSSANSIGAALRLLKNAEKNRLQRLHGYVNETFRSHKARLVLTIVAAVFCLSLIPAPYMVRSECEIQPAAKRYVAAPFDGQLNQCLVEPGDVVSKDQIIARLDDREINLELDEIEAQLHQAMKTYDGHVASHKSGEARLAQLEADRLRARRDLLKYRSENLELRSPLDGIVISGDLKKAQGVPLKTGDSLFEIAPLQDLFVELAIPDDDIRFVKSGMPVWVALDAYPFERWQGKIERVHPSAEIRDEDNVFIATVQILNQSGKLRPGMQGRAKTKTSWRPICWIYLHKPIAKGLRWLGW